MDKEKKARLEARGWKVGSAEEFLDLTAEEAAYIELRLKLSDAVREYRKKKQLTQVQLAELLQSSQSRVAKVEAAMSPCPWISSSAHFSCLELLIRILRR